MRLQSRNKLIVQSLDKVLLSLWIQKERGFTLSHYYNVLGYGNQPMVGAVRATGVDSTAARSKGKLCAFLSCITSIPRPALLRTSAQVFTTRDCESTMDWLKLKPLRLKAMVETPSAVNQIPTTGQAARKKWSERELLKEAYWLSLIHI